MIPLSVLKDFHEVDQQQVEILAAAMGEDNAFQQLLFTANIFRKANCTPIFLVNESQTAMLVTSKETYGKRLH
jgi:hypothetical protein